jgi:hypothetical protein
VVTFTACKQETITPIKSLALSNISLTSVQFSNAPSSIMDVLSGRSISIDALADELKMAIP